MPDHVPTSRSYCGYRTPIFQLLMLFLGIAAAGLAGTFVWYAAADYHEIPCYPTACQLIEGNQNCNCSTYYNNGGDKVTTCDYCYSVLCIANSTDSQNPYRKFVASGQMSNITALQRMKDILDDRSCCISHFDPLHAFGTETCQKTRTLYDVFLSLAVLLTLLFIIIVLENFHHGIKNPLSNLPIEIEGWFAPTTSFIHPLACSALDYFSCWAINGAIYIGLPIFGGMIAGAVCWGVAAGNIHHTTAYMTGCVGTPKYAPSNTSLYHGLACDAEFYMHKIHRNVSWTFVSGSYWNSAVATQRIKEINNTNMAVHYWKNYNDYSSIDNHYHILFDSTDPDVFANYQLLLAGIILLCFCTTMLFGFAIVRECWRRKLKRDYLKYKSHVSESQRLVSPVVNSVANPPVVPTYTTATAARKQFATQPSSSSSASSSSSSSNSSAKPDYKDHTTNKPTPANYKSEKNNSNSNQNEKEKALNEQHSKPNYKTYSGNEKEKALHAQYSGPSYTTYSGNAPASIYGNVQSTSTTDRSSDDDDKHTCNICTEREKNTVLNCGHTLCRPCSLQVAECPFCKEFITARTQMFL